MSRIDLAEDIASGLCGWLQLQHAQKLGGLSGEDTARAFMTQIINAQGRYLPKTSQLPNNWDGTKKRIDVAVLGRSTGSNIWYGAIEVKWPGHAFDPHQTRLHIAQDIARLSFIKTDILNAKFLVIGGNNESLKKLFDTPHPSAPDREGRRRSLCDLLSRDISIPNGKLTYTQWSQHFEKIDDRVPPKTFNLFKGQFKTTLLATNESKTGTKTTDSVYKTSPTIGDYWHRRWRYRGLVSMYCSLQRTYAKQQSGHC